MKTIVITGGTDGLGRALARKRLDHGDHVVVIGRSHEKFATLGGGEFLPADLTLISENRRVLKEIGDRPIDALVLAAAYANFPRVTTAEGIEHNFALYHLSRFLLADGLHDNLRATANPVIIDTTVPGANADAIHWDDLNLDHGYTWKAANEQSRRATFLRAAGRTHEDPVPHVLINPGFVRSSHQGSLTGIRRGLVGLLARLMGTAPERAIAPLEKFLDQPPAEPLSAYQGSKRLPVHIDDHTLADAHRLATLTDELLT
ncbi:SDR family NAD(P)-dependent oxidoreductase [Amycolatopsis sp. 195334CR]|uniref:SDR family NAD(P)-dependent oxidoreductase n=1 Tax=Amycolatopsis sp. 195334CR TaxID=2814588 RepID=UPI001A8E2318|nr:SDR family NAD(P)-dependent oxidoreductase [Amycolatopsis sp. 195334CR]MBN6040143.1 SDR family NAD(P)-dependent oxidoreductase [Amycolatopsis sp. 195334CR]